MKMKYAVINIKDALRFGYLDPDQKWEGKELLIGEDGYAYIDDVATDPVEGDWDFQEALEYPDFKIIEI